MIINSSKIRLCYLCSLLFHSLFTLSLNCYPLRLEVVLVRLVDLVLVPPVDLDLLCSSKNAATKLSHPAGTSRAGASSAVILRDVSELLDLDVPDFRDFLPLALRRVRVVRRRVPRLVLRVPVVRRVPVPVRSASLSLTALTASMLMQQLTPSPKSPALQRHSKLPGLLMHSAPEEQLSSSFSHSFISSHRLPFP